VSPSVLLTPWSVDCDVTTLSKAVLKILSRITTAKKEESDPTALVLLSAAAAAACYYDTAVVAATIAPWY
jgi:hypothetical protein